MAREIPGYYYDEEKRKYFKIERTQTAGPSAAWSQTAVKRRRVQDEAENATSERQRLLKNHIKRHPLSQDHVANGLLARETDNAVGLRSRLDVLDTAAEAWTMGIVDKGYVPYAPSFARNRYNHMPCMYVGGDDVKTGLGVTYASLDGETVLGSYIPTDSEGQIQYDSEAPMSSGRSLSFRSEMIRCPQMSSISYHAPSHKIMLTSREPDASCGLYFFSPPLSDQSDLDRPHWLLGETNHYQRLSIRHRLRDEWLVHKSTPAPASSDLICAIGTNAGILRVMSNETMSWASAQTPPKGTQSPQEIFDLDFVRGNHNVLVAGGRQPRLWTADLRTQEAEWTCARHASTITHVRSLTEHHVLVAGLEHNMCLYDLRFMALQAPTPIHKTASSRPLLSFPGYRNEAHIHTGFDVSTELNVVASAQDDGIVRLFSLRSGRQILPKPAMPGTRSLEATRKQALGGIWRDVPVRAMMFQTMPRDKMPSLFVGDGPLLRKFSFGAEALDAEV